MLRIGQVESSATADGKYTDGSVAGGIPATRLRAAALNAIQEELANIVESAGLSLDPNNMAQVLTALKKQFLSRSNPFGDIKLDGNDAITTARANLGFADLGFGIPNITKETIIDWQQFDFINGASYRTIFGNWVNPPSDMTFTTSQINVQITVIGISGTSVVLEVSPYSVADSNYCYFVYLNGGKGSRTFKSRQYFTSSTVVPIEAGGTGAKTVSGVLSNLGLSGIVNLGTPTGSLAGKILRIPFYNGSTVETLIVQWMDVPAVPANGGSIVTYPTPFPNSMLSINATGGATLPGVPGVNVQSVDRTSCKIWNQSTTASTQLGAIIAIGR